MSPQRRSNLFTFLLVWVVGGATHRAFAQQTNVTCDGAFDWAKNSKGQSPCLVAAYLQGACYPDRHWNVTSLSPGTEYLAPSGNAATGCACSSPVYQLLSACAACQGQSYLSWGQWTTNCPPARISNGSFPLQVPTDTAIPQWALAAIRPEAYFDPQVAKGEKSANTQLTGATTFLIVLLPVMLVGLAGFGILVWWRRKARREHEGSTASHEPLMGSAAWRNTFLSVDTTSDVHIHFALQSADSANTPYGHDKPWQQVSPVPPTLESARYSPYPSSGQTSPAAQYSHYPEVPLYHPNQQFLAPPSAGATSTSLNVSHHSPTPSQCQLPLTSTTNQTFTSQMDPPRHTQPEPMEIENDSGTFPRTPVEPLLPSLPLGDPRRLLPPSVLANYSAPPSATSL
ncbi:hypothetical protein CTheo_6530 [Ceratobasidium theobromae]|uniref:Transmembrane protein n=1 Tax=Ceratobasidium theobromae TaxID=1582974 RepID=A0A5N5QE60_9AGAM|nr:hypothetical protein CTheo_6530 [Ceratobasidium theobromae]